MLTWIVGPGEATWSRPDPNAVNLTPEKASYSPGQTAQILVTSPWPNATNVEGIASIEREQVMSMQRISIVGGVAAISVPIPAAGAPNVSIAVTLFKPATAKDRPEARIGRVDLIVKPEAHRLNVTVKADAATYKPGSPAVATVAIKEATGRAAPGQVTLWAVDEGVLRLSGYTVPDLLAVLWSPRPVLVSTADARTRLYVAPTPIGDEEAGNRRDARKEKGALSAEAAAPRGVGGGAQPVSDAANANALAFTGNDDGKSEVPTLRTDFRVLAHWAGAVQVAANATATVGFTLPQSLTTYRILAVATSGAEDFGGATTTVEIRQPFMVQPAVPRFVTPGDTFEAGAVIQNQTGAAGQASLTISIDGPLTIDGAMTQTRTVPTGPTEVRFKLRATALGTAKLRLNATFTGAGHREADAVAAEIPIRRTQRIETVAAAGTVEAGKAITERLTVPTNIEPDAGGLEATVSSSALAGLQSGVESLVQYPYGCLEQRSSRIRALLMLTDLKSTFPLASIGQTDLRTVVINELARIPNYRTPDGGLGYWEGSSIADPYLTARMLVLLLDADRLGVPAPTGLRDGIVSYLRGVLEQAPARDDAVWLSRASILEALARSGAPNNALAGRLYRQRWDLPIDQQIDLLAALVEGGDTSNNAPTLYRELLSSVRVEADQAFLQQDRSWSDVGPWAWYRFSDDTHLTAALLSIVAKVDPKGALAGPMARWLLAQRGKDGAWANTYENASALTGLVDYARAAEPEAGQLQATITAGATPILSATFAPHSLDISSGSVALTQLRDGAVRVQATGVGRANYTLRLRYAPALKSLRPIDQGFTVTRDYRTYTGQGQPATSFAAGELVRVRLTVKSAQARRQVVIDDPIPAGLEILNTNLASTSTAEATGTGVSSGGLGGAFGVDHTEIRDDRVLLFASSLSAGTLVYDYVARATAPGHFVVAPAQAEEMYRPEIFGRNATAEIEVRP